MSNADDMTVLAIHSRPVVPGTYVVWELGRDAIRRCSGSKVDGRTLLMHGQTRLQDINPIES